MACDARVAARTVRASARCGARRSRSGATPRAARRKYVSRNVGDSFPLVGTELRQPRRDRARLRAARAHARAPGPVRSRSTPTTCCSINGMSGAGKTMAAIILLIARDRAGRERLHHRPRRALRLPRVADPRRSVARDRRRARTRSTPGTSTTPRTSAPRRSTTCSRCTRCCWASITPARDSYGLTDLEANLLGLAIAEVYERCALTGEEPRELLLQEELERRYQRERDEGSVGIAEALRNLAMRLNNYIARRPLRLPRRPPDDDPRRRAAGRLRHALDPRGEGRRRAVRDLRARQRPDRAARAARTSPATARATPGPGARFLVIDEAWKLIERPATGRWFNEFCRRSRHYALWLIAISQQLSDFDNEHGKALLANAAMRLFLRQEAARARLRQGRARSSPTRRSTRSPRCRPPKGEYSTAYLMNGARGEGTLQIGVGPLEYWIASSDPARDEPVRQPRSMTPARIPGRR